MEDLHREWLESEYETMRIAEEITGGIEGWFNVESDEDLRRMNILQELLKAAMAKRYLAWRALMDAR